ncbi:MAG: DUF6798 domain-containing protein [Bacteroidota bacterium]
MSSSSHSPRSNAPAALLAGSLVAALHPLRYGYTYGAGDHDDLLPPIQAWLEPGLFSQDAYVQSQLDGVTVRTVFQALVRSLGGFLELPLAVGIFHLLVAVGVGAGVFLLARALRAGRTASLLATLLACVVVPGATIGGNRVIYSLLAPEGIAWALLVPALALFARKRRLQAAVMIGFAAWFHLLAAGLVAIALTAVALVEAASRPRDVQQAAAFGGLSALVAAPVAIPVLLQQAAEARAILPDGLDAFTLYAVVRFPHHYLPHASGETAWALTVLLGVLGLLGYGIARQSERPPHVRFPVRFAIVSVVLMAAAAVGIYGFESLSAARAQAFKLTLVLNVLACIGIAVGVLARVPASVRQPADRFLRHRRWLLTWIAGFVLVLASFARVSPDRGPAHAIAEWAQFNTPRQAVFAVPPSLASFRVTAERSVVGTWKSVPFRADLASEWWQRLMAVAPLDPVPASGAGLLSRLDSSYAAQPDAARQRLADRYGADFAVLPRQVQTQLPVAFATDDWTVVRLREPTEGE